jgi:hypothetical protein
MRLVTLVARVRLRGPVGWGPFVLRRECIDWLHEDLDCRDRLASARGL